MIPAADLPDRVDVIERNLDVDDQVVSVADAAPLARNVPCLISSASDRGSALAALLGFSTAPKLSCVMNAGGGLTMRSGWLLQRSGESVRYAVNSVDFYPNEHRAEFMVADLSEDVGAAA